uniref:glucuronosyltransferase n=1 Tax=Meloidogyne incognita TaxID=6306 RepID=A0A914MW16_MELIC
MFYVFEHCPKCTFKVRVRTTKESYKNIEITKKESLLPQQEILAKVNTKLLISHCGQNSLNEAMYAGVPIICIPDGGDQFYNASLVEQLEIGIYIKVDYVHRNYVDFGNHLYYAVEKILNDPKYQHNATILGKNILNSNESRKNFFLKTIDKSIRGKREGN